MGIDIVSPNFAFLAAHDALLVEYAARAERYVFQDPNTALIKLRQFAEALAKLLAARFGEYIDDDDKFIDILNRLRSRGVIDGQLAGLFHDIRRKGNDAVHGGSNARRDALHQLRMARNLAVWFHKAVTNDPDFRPGPFVPPPDPAAVEQDLARELAELREERAEGQRALEQTAQRVEDAEARRNAAEATAAKAYQDLEAALALAEETEAAQSEAHFNHVLAAQQEQAAASSPEALAARVQQAQQATATLELSEADTRKLIDLQLQQAGWRADTQELIFANGTRPQKGVNMAIAEWPTASGPADYVLFAGLTPLAVVEAKRKNKDCQGAIEQAKRYSRDFTVLDGATLADGCRGDYRVPFLFSANGRPYLKQIESKSGIWFLDVRVSTNHPRVLKGWYTPEGLKDLLEQNLAEAESRLQTEPLDYLPLRDYQRAAIEATEAAIAAGQRQMLLAMATGTGKTRTCIGLVYRLIKTKRFKRILFLVDRSALGEQAANAFKDVELENLKTFTNIYDVKELDGQTPDADTRLHLATVQGMVRRLLYPPDGEAPIPIDRYDCIVIDECHRGYNLDQEMTERELTFRNERDYISKYRAVVEHFDAVKVGLTATPALHTTEIFGPPIFEYSYRQAVIEGYLVDHEPPLRVVTKLAEDGITYLAGEEIQVYRAKTQQLDLFRTPDEVNIDIDDFNRRVITESFNRVVCRELARHIDPSLEGKTLVFCLTDAHADMVVGLLKEAFDEEYGAVEDDAVCKVTGAADRPGQLIRRYKNERLPAVAVTVDLLTTGIDVPEIVNLVFIRRVRSRILYEQMLGRATRLCPEIGKQNFRIFDCVDLYAAIQDYSTMTPVVTRPHISFKQLLEELGTLVRDADLDEVKDQLTAKLQHKKRGLQGGQLDAFITLAGMPPEDLIKFLRKASPTRAFNWFDERPELVTWLDKPGEGDGPSLIISQHPDELRRVEHGYGTAARPEDYLESFGRFINANMNAVPALTLVTQRPRDLTRAELKALRLQLDSEGFTETALQTAWRDTTNQDIAASIIGYIRQAALGSPLTPYNQRVDRAMADILARRPWTNPQRKWLERIGSQLRQEVIVDRDALDRGQFKAQGGFNRLNKVFDGQLGELLQDINEAVWEDTA